MKPILLRHGRIIDPANRRDEVGDLLLVDGRIADQSAIRNPQSAIEEIDATGLIVAPGLIDLHVHFREPGQSAKETIASGARCAAAGGFTSVVAMPNTSPTVDSPSVVTWILEKAKAEACVNVFASGEIGRASCRERV